MSTFAPGDRVMFPVTRGARLDVARGVVLHSPLRGWRKVCVEAKNGDTLAVIEVPVGSLAHDPVTAA